MLVGNKIKTKLGCTISIFTIFIFIAHLIFPITYSVVSVKKIKYHKELCVVRHM